MTSAESVAHAAAQAWEALFRAQVEIMRRFERDNIFDEISFREYDVLFTLRTAGHPGLRLKELNEYVLLHQSALSRLVERLELRGLVSRIPDPHDGRGTIITLTEAGRAMQRKYGQQHVDQIAHYVGTALNREELEALERITEKLRHSQVNVTDFRHHLTGKTERGN
ncbi:MarR family winged helix-turn-helix transcriptional regulator [Timonella sp. A28]|uniref:MarR family winged helix-turn-helix transcriptional regulator n=1 Tax=Timonella sp. A28 TaxID=3442640 RepID=UPI003EBB4D8A